MLLEAAPHTTALDRIGAEEIGSRVVLMDRVDAALSDGRVENRKGQVRSLIDLRSRLSGRLERWLREFGVTRRREPSGPRGSPGAGSARRSGAASRRWRRRSSDSARSGRSPGGRIHVPDVPGIGFELHDEAWQAFRSLVPPPD